jgi:hypothetical protein
MKPWPMESVPVTSQGKKEELEIEIHRAALSLSCTLLGFLGARQMVDGTVET